MVNRGKRTFSHQDIQRAKNRELLVYRTLMEEKDRVRIDRLQREHFGPWSDVFSSMERCRGRVLLCFLGPTLIGYQAFEPSASKGSPFSPDLQVMRLTFVLVRQDSAVRARGLGIGTELIRRTLDLAWARGYQAVYTYATAYELMIKAGMKSHGGEEILAEAMYVRNFDQDQAPPLLFVVERSSPDSEL